MDSSMAVPSHVKVVVVIFVLFIAFQFYFQNAMRSDMKTVIQQVDPKSTQIDPNTLPTTPDTLIKINEPTPVKVKETPAVAKPTPQLRTPPVEKKPVSGITPEPAASNQQPEKEPGNRCGGPSHTMKTRPCASNDTVCGSWSSDRYFRPTTCEYQDITSEQARKCLGGRTLAFIGDSQMRDLAVGVSLFLLGKKIESSSKFKVDHKLNNHMELNGTRMPDMPSFGNDTSIKAMNYLFPSLDVAKAKGYPWQVQYYGLARKKAMREPLTDVLNNVMPSQWPALKPITMAFFSHGLQDYGWWNTAPSGEKFYSSMVKEWAEQRKTLKVPSVWVSLNSQCAEMLKVKGGGKGKLPPIVDEVNAYVNKRAKREKVPYWDAAAALRTPDRCDLLDDGVHVKMFVDIMRAKMLFNHMCDNNMNWRGAIDRFI